MALELTSVGCSQYYAFQSVLNASFLVKDRIFTQISTIAHRSDVTHIIA